jgi:methyl-accepting chemotaxis protein
MKKSIKFKLGLIMGTFLVLVVATIVMTFWTLGALKSDGKVINMAGRQRMLSQKITKETMALLQGKTEKRELLATVGLFDKSLKALISGDVQQGIPATEDPKILATLKEGEEQWKPFKGNVEEMSGDIEKKNAITNYLNSNNTVLLREMNKAVGMMDTAGVDAKTVNLAGSLRMFSQKITKEALALDLGLGSETEMLASTSRFDKVLNGLINGDAELGLKASGDAAILAQLRKVEGEWKPFKSNVENLVEENHGLEKHTTFILTENVPLLKKMNGAVVLFEAYSAAKLAKLKSILLACLAVTVVVFIAAWIILAKVIINPVKRIAELTKQVAEGDLSGDNLNIKTNDELGELARSVDDMKVNLNMMIGSIRDSATKVSRGSEQTADANVEFSQKITEQSSSVEETASTMEEISAGVKQNADTCIEANKLSLECRNKAEEGGTVMGDMVTSIEEIHQSGKKISDIINVIEEISFQTNLLALNAAVEAARAGEQGKGFAVVAVEVRNLAHRSSEAAKEITSLIKDNLAKAEGGTHYASTTQKTLEEIIGSVKKVADLISEINAASQEQSAGIDQTNQAIGQLDQVTQHNASLLQQFSATSDDLNAEAAQLMSLVGNFKVSDAGTGAPSTTVTKAASTKVTPIRPTETKEGTSRQEFAQAVGGDVDEFVEL